MSAFKFKDHERDEIKQYMDSWSEWENNIDRIEAIVNERADQETAELRRQVEELQKRIELISLR